MPHVSFASLVVVAAIAVAAPLLVGLFPRVRVPAVVLEIVAGIVVGPHGLKLVEHIDAPVQILALVGFAATLALGLVAGAIFKAAGTVRSPLFLAVALAATSLGLVVPVLKDAGKANGELGQLTIAASSVADFGAVILLTLFFSSEGSTGPGATLVLLGGFVILVVVAGVALSRLDR